MRCEITLLFNHQTYTPSTVIFDLADTDTVDRAAEEILKCYGQVDVLINNAGISYRGNILDTARCYGNKLLWAYCSHSRWVRSAAWTFWSKRQKWELDCHGHFLDFSGDEHCFTPAAVPPPTNFSFPPSQLSCPQWFAGAVVTLWSSAVSDRKSVV